jgi:hypothetical protein
MAKILIVGDSQAQGTPGLYAERKFRAAGHTTRRISHHGKGAIDYVSTPALWSEYTGAVQSFAPDVVVLIFGSNDFGSRLDDALIRMKDAVRQPVWLSGPPRYPAPDRQRLGETIRSTNQQVFGSRWIDAYPFTPLSIPRDSLQAHLPGEGGRPWGEAIADAVMRETTSAAPGGAATRPFVGTASSPAKIAAVIAGTVAVGALVVLLLSPRR